MKSNTQFVCPLKWFNIRLIAFWSFTNRFSANEFPVGLLHSVCVCVHFVHSSSSSSLVDCDRTRTMIQSCVFSAQGGPMRFTIKFIALCLAPKWQNIHWKKRCSYTQRTNESDSLCSTSAYVYICVCKWLSNSISVPFVENCLTRNATATTKQLHQPPSTHNKIRRRQTKLH